MRESRHKIANSVYLRASVLWNSLQSDIGHVTHHITPPIFNSPVSDLSTSLFLKKLKTHLFHCFFLLSLIYL